MKERGRNGWQFSYPYGQELVLSKLPAQGRPYRFALRGFLANRRQFLERIPWLTVISHTTGRIWSSWAAKHNRLVDIVRYMVARNSPTNRGVTVHRARPHGPARFSPQMLQETKLDGDYFDARATDNFGYQRRAPSF